MLPAPVLHGSPTPESLPNNETPSLVADTPRLKTSTITSSLSPASPFLRDQSAPDDVVHNTGSLHDEGVQYHCPECNVDFKVEASLRRHIRTANAHVSSAFQCRCARLVSRKDNFRRHIKGKRFCEPIVPFLCSCGHQVESSKPDSISLILEHIKDCGRKRGRPRI